MILPRSIPPGLWADSKARPVLVWRAGGGTIPPQITGLPLEAVTSMAQALEYLEKLMKERRRGDSVFGRLRNAFGKAP